MLLGFCSRGLNPSYSMQGKFDLTHLLMYFFKLGSGFKVGCFLFWRLFLVFGALSRSCY